MRWKEGEDSILSNAVRLGTCLGWLLPMIFCGLALVIGCGRETSAPETLSTREALSPRETLSPREATPGATSPALSDGSSRRGASEGIPQVRSRPSEERGSYFRDVTSKTGIDFTFQSGRSAGEYAILESLGGGVGVVDFDRDGWVDLMFAGGGDLDNKQVTALPCALFRNQGGLRFEEVTEQAGVAADEFYNHGIFPADFDQDGFPDLAVSGYGGVQLFRNMGDGTFLHVETLVSHEELAWSTSLAWADLNGNGHLDLYVAHYVDWSWEKHPICSSGRGQPREVCAPREFQGLTDAIYLSDGEGGFQPPSEPIGLVPEGKGLGVTIGDVNDDGRVDIYVANDTTENFLYLNQGDGTFREVAAMAGVSGDDVGIDTGSMGVLMADLQGSGVADIWVTNFERELFGLYRNEGDGLFLHVSRSAGLAVLGGLYVGFGTVAIDLDYDGDLDLVVANGHVSYHSEHTPLQQRPILLKSNGRGRFRLLDEGGYFGREHTGRGLAYADLDNDGAWELIFTHVDEPVAILSSAPANHDSWWMVRLVGRSSNRDAIGTTVRVVLEGLEENGDSGTANRPGHFERRNFVRLWMLNGGGSYLSQSDSRLLLVVPPAVADLENPDSKDRLEAEVRWPSGHVERFPLDPNGRSLTWREGEGIASPDRRQDARSDS